MLNSIKALLLNTNWRIVGQQKSVTTFVFVAWRRMVELRAKFSCLHKS